MIYELVGPVRDQWMVLAKHDQVVEVLYRARHQDRAETALGLVERAHDRGVLEHQTTGWPDGVTYPLYVLDRDEDVCMHLDPIWTLSERDVDINSTVHQTTHPTDAKLLLTACQRASSIGAMVAAGRDAVRGYAHG